MWIADLTAMYCWTLKFLQLSYRQSIGAGPSPAQPPDGETNEGAQVLLHITTHDWEPWLGSDWPSLESFFSVT